MTLLPFRDTETRRRRALARAGVAATVAIVAAALGAAAEAADKPPEPGLSSVSQYAELVPTASGPVVPGGKGVTSIGAEAKLLDEIATSRDYGAPSKSRGATSNRSARDVEPSVARTLSAAAAAASPAGDARVLGLLVALVAMTAGAAALSLRRGRFSVPAGRA